METRIPHTPIFLQAHYLEVPGLPQSGANLNGRQDNKETNHQAPDPRAPKWIRYDERLQRLVNNYDDYFDPKNYWRAQLDV